MIHVVAGVFLIIALIRIIVESIQEKNPLPPIDDWEQYQKDVIDMSVTGVKNYDEHHAIIRQWRKEGKYNH